MSRRTSILVLALLIALVTGSAAQTTAPSKLDQPAVERLFAEANNRYYNLQGKGFQGLTCILVPDWRTMYARLVQGAPANSPFLDVLESTKIRLKVSAAGLPSISREAGVEPTSVQVADSSRQALAGFEQTIGGFFQSWAPMVVTPIWTDTKGMQVERRESGYVITGDENNVTTTMEMDSDYRLIALSVGSSGTTITMKPVFTQTEQGFLLTGYTSAFPTGANVADLKLDIEYQLLRGLQVPKSFIAFITAGEMKIDMRIAFEGCEVQRKGE